MDMRDVRTREAGGVKKRSAVTQDPPRTALVLVPRHRGRGSLRRLGLAQTGDAVAFFPLVPGLEHGDALEAFQDIALTAGGGSGA